MAVLEKRLRLGRLELVPAGRSPRWQRLWCMPGGATATFGEVVEYARRMGLPKPVVITVSRETKKQGDA